MLFVVLVKLGLFWAVILLWDEPHMSTKISYDKLKNSWPSFMAKASVFCFFFLLTLLRRKSEYRRSKTQIN